MITLNWPKSISDNILKHVINFFISKQCFFNSRFNLCNLNWINISIDIVRCSIPNMIVRTITKILNDSIQCITDIIFTVNTFISNNTISNCRYKCMCIVTASNNCVCCSRYKCMCILICLSRNTNVDGYCSSLFNYCTCSCRYKSVC